MSAAQALDPGAPATTATEWAEHYAQHANASTRIADAMLRAQTLARAAAAELRAAAGDEYADRYLTTILNGLAVTLDGTAARIEATDAQI